MSGLALETEQLLRTLVEDKSAAIVLSYADACIRSEMPALLAFDYINELRYEHVSTVLKKVLSDYGFSIEQQLGILLLIKINGFLIPETFKNNFEANEWLVTTTQKLKRLEERFSVENKQIEDRLTPKRESVIDAASLLGMTQQIKSDLTQLGPYQAAVPGALEMRVIQRSNEAASEAKEALSKSQEVINEPPKVWPQRVFLVVGERKLQDFEAAEITEQSERTEKVMAERTWAKVSAEHRLPFVSCFAVFGAKKPEAARAVTADTTKDLASHPELDPKLPLCLYIEQPYARRFFSIFQKALPTQVVLRSRAVDIEKGPLFLYQDETARLIFFNNLRDKYKAEAATTTSIEAPKDLRSPLSASAV